MKNYVKIFKGTNPIEIEQDINRFAYYNNIISVSFAPYLPEGQDYSLYYAVVLYEN